MVTVHKYPLEICAQQTIDIPALAENDAVVALNRQVLHVDIQEGKPCLWVMVDASRPAEPRKIIIKGTGHDCGGIDREDFLGSFQTPFGIGSFVGHIFGK